MKDVRHGHEVRTPLGSMVRAVKATSDTDILNGAVSNLCYMARRKDDAG